MSLQEIIVLLIVSACVTYCAQRLRSSFRKRNTPPAGCGHDCPGCPLSEKMKKDCQKKPR